MVMETMVREGFNVAGKQRVFVYRTHENELPEFLRMKQDKGGYIISVRRLVVLRPMYPAYDDPRYDVRNFVKERDDKNRTIEATRDDSGVLL